MAKKKEDEIQVRVKNIEKKIEKIESLLKGKTFARFKYVKMNYKYIKDIYAKLNAIEERLPKSEKENNYKS